FYSISYVDAFAGTGSLRTPELAPFADLMPELRVNEEEYRKGSVRRALEVEPSFDKYVFIETSAKKCDELKAIAASFTNKEIKIINEDANAALLEWCKSLNVRRERAVVFLDPFGASVDWEVVAALGRTRAVDLWVLFPFFAVNRMLIRDRKPPQAWASRLTAVFGSTDWEKEFYSSTIYTSLLDPAQGIELTYKTADERRISKFFVRQLQGEFEAVAPP